MLDDVKKLSESLTDKQSAALQSMLEEDQFKSLQSFIDSSSDKELKKNMKILKKKMNEMKPFELFQLSMIFNSEQRKVIMAIGDL